MLDVNCWESKFTDCVYSVRLLKKLELLNQEPPKRIEICKIKKAIYYAKKYHGDQKRQSGEPYYSHPLEVAFMVSDYLFKTDVLVISILHDVIEDTELSKESLNYLFNDNIANQVEYLTRVKSGYKISSYEILKSLYLENQYDLLLIKYFDRLHNIKTIKAKTTNKIFKIVEETLISFVSLGIYFESYLPGFTKENEAIINLCYQELNVQSLSPPDVISIYEDDFQLPFLVYQSKKFPKENLLIQE